MIEAKVLKNLGHAWSSATPGFHVQALRQGQTIIDLRVGLTYPQYDWASMTKMVLTLTSFMKLVDMEEINEEDSLRTFLPELTRLPAEIKLRHLLSHTASLPSSIHFWEMGQALTDPAERRALWRSKVLALPIAVNERSSYSEIDFQILGYVLETILGSDLETIWADLAAQMGLHKTMFRPLERSSGRDLEFAPTEICPLRQKRMQGEVHHPDVWLTGGAGWLAGLFGPMSEFALWAQGLRAAYFDDGWIIRRQTVRRFAQRQVGSSSLGFMMPKQGRGDGQKYYLSAGARMSPTSIGHTGFTGPMFWFDLERDLLILTLANRTFPTSSNENWFNFRGVLHDVLVQAIDDEFGQPNSERNRHAQ